MSVVTLAPPKPMALGVLKTLLYGAGSLVIVAAVAVYLTKMELAVLLAWLEQVFSISFVVLYFSLMALGVYAASRLDAEQSVVNDGDSAFWHELGQQAASGVATLALTYTLLGLSMGIGSLSDQAITPASITPIIQGLTAHFSTAFMTTVVGLPSANILRAMISLRWVKLQSARSHSDIQ